MFRNTGFTIFTLVLALLSNCIETDAQENQSRYPKWSWDKVPVYLHFGSKTQLTDEQVLKAARMSNFICLEKAHGRLSDRAQPERIMAFDAKRLKEANPDARVLFYWNTLIAWPFISTTQDFAQRHPDDWVFRTLADREPILKTKLADTPVYQYNLLNPETRAWWAKTAGDAVEELGFDGVYMDAISQAKRPAYLKEGWGTDKGSALDDAAVDMMKRLRAEMGDEPLLIFNGLRTVDGVADKSTNGGSKFLAFGDGAKIEHFDQLASTSKEDILLYWQMATKAAAQGKIILYKAWPDHGANFTNPEFMKRSPEDKEAFAREKMTFPLACFLVAAQPNSYFCYGWGYDIDDGQLVDYSEYDRPLGPPKGNAVRSSEHPWTFTREFEYASVQVDLEKREAQIAWKSDGQTVVVKTAPSTQASKTQASTEQEIADHDWESSRKRVLALGVLTDAPKMVAAENMAEEDGMKPIFFDGLPYQGKPTRVFAWLGVADSANAATPSKVPGVVLVHGGGGTAFKEWVKKWNEAGFAAISIAVEGQTDHRLPLKPGQRIGDWESHQWAGPARNGIYGDSDQPLEDQWMYHAVADTVLANSLLRSLPGVDKDRVGLMGVSWGGVIASTVVGIDSRFDFAIPTYGCGHLADAPNQYGRALGTNDLYRQVWDPMNRLPRAKLPILWFSWPGDLHFPLDCQSACYKAASGPHMVSLVPGMRHGHGPAWNRGESYAFAKSVAQTGEPWYKQSDSNSSNGVCSVAMTSTPDHRFAEAKLISTIDSGAHGERKWIESPATLDQQGVQWVAKAKIPAGSTAWFMNLRSGDLLVSSDLFEVDRPKEPEKPAVSDRQSKLIARMDKDADGKVSQSEYLGHYASTFARFDTDESGKLDAREFTNSAAMRFGDSDKDGKLTLAEYLSVFEKQFSNLDKNSDGYVESEEW